MKQLWMWTAILILLTSSTGCLFSRTTVVYAGFAKSPVELKGAIKIATNKKVPITVEGDDAISTMDLGGMYAVRGADLKLLIQMANAKND